MGCAHAVFVHSSCVSLYLCAKTYFIELHTDCSNSFSYRSHFFLLEFVCWSLPFTSSSKASKINSKWLFLNYDFIFRNYKRIDFYAEIPITQRDERRPYVETLKLRNQSREKTTQISNDKDHLRRRTSICSTRKNKGNRNVKWFSNKHFPIRKNQRLIDDHETHSNLQWFADSKMSWRKTTNLRWNSLCIRIRLLRFEKQEEEEAGPRHRMRFHFSIFSITLMYFINNNY